ncbi:MAG: hypothetical protein ABIF10_06355 [Candidatus Woesearchaeota archaeon]
MRTAIWLLLLCIFASSANAAIEATAKCSHQACIEGTDLNFTVSIYNNLRTNIMIDDVYIKDIETGQLLAFDAEKARILPRNEQVDLVLQTEVKAPLRGYTFYYVPCFKAQSFDDTRIIAEGEVCGEIIRSLTVLPLNKVECRTDGECENNEYCNTKSVYQCRQLECEQNETAINHECSKLSCNILQYSQNHACRYNLEVISGLALAAIVITALIVIFYKK